MLKLQNILLFLGLGLFSLLYFGFDVKPKKFDSVERNIAESTQSTDISNLIRDVQSTLSPDQASLLIALEREVEAASSDSLKSSLLKQLSGKWFEYGQPHIAGFYAEQVALIDNSTASWSIAGTSFAATFKGPFEEKVKEYSHEKAIAAFESAISLDPTDIRSKVNLALCYVERPLKENPMKGILMLLDYDKQYPDNELVLLNLGRLAIQTGQHEKAIVRLEKVITINPDNAAAFCLLAKAYEQTGNMRQAALYQESCNREARPETRE